MTEYPEHDKLHEVAELSQAIGEFLDFGLPKLGLMLYQRATRPCESRHRCARSALHTEEELATMVDGRVQYTEWIPTHRSIPSMLAEYFGIDQKKIDAEKDAMLAAIQAANG